MNSIKQKPLIRGQKGGSVIRAGSPHIPRIPVNPICTIINLCRGKIGTIKPTSDQDPTIGQKGGGMLGDVVENLHFQTLPSIFQMALAIAEGTGT